MADAVKGPAQGPKPNGAAKVLVTVRTYAGQVPCAGRVFGPDETEFAAAPADVRDLLAIADQLIIKWPQDFVLPNGLKPSTGRVIEAAPPTLTSADRVAIAEEQSRVNLAKIARAERALDQQRSEYEARIGELTRANEDLQARVVGVSSVVSDAEVRAASDAEALKQREAEFALEIDALKQQHKAELDTAKAQFATALEASQTEQERLQAEVDRLTAALDAATAPKKRQPAQPATPPANG